jgi:hypothetical protein
MSRAELPGVVESQRLPDRILLDGFADLSEQIYRTANAKPSE